MAEALDSEYGEDLEWSDELYTLREFVEKYENDLPQILKVSEGVYDDDTSFSTGEICKIHGVRRESKILATVRKQPGNSLEKITIPMDFNGMLAVIPDGHKARAVNPENEYSVDELLDQFKLPVKVKFTNYDRETNAMLHELGGADTIFNLMKEVQETYVIGSTKVDGVRYMCIMTLDYDDVEFFVAEDDSADYELIVDKFKLPNIEVDKMNNMPYLEYYEKPKVYRQEESLYLNVGVPVQDVPVQDVPVEKTDPGPGPSNIAKESSHAHDEDEQTPPPLPPRQLHSYSNISTMLSELDLEDQLPNFVKNGIRDSVLLAEWEDLKSVLKECGFVPGVILEIKLYLQRKKPPSPCKVNGNDNDDNGDDDDDDYDNCEGFAQARQQKVIADRPVK
ncbi:uncharacterized protein LOC144445239 [Glandiceps talaboti]